LFDTRTGTFLDSSTNQRVPFREAIGKIVDISDVEVEHPETHRMMSLQEAIGDGLVNAETRYFNAATGLPLSLEQAMMLGYIMGWMARELSIEPTSPDSSKSLAALMHSGLLDTDTGLVYDAATGEKISIEEAVKRGIVDGRTACMYDTESGTMLTVEECLNRGLMNSSAGTVTDVSSGQERRIADIIVASQVVDTGDRKHVERSRVSGDFTAAAVAEAEARKSVGSDSGLVQGTAVSVMETSGDVSMPSLGRAAAAGSPASTEDLSRRSVSEETSPLKVIAVHRACC